MILVADAHVGPGNRTDFFRMLDALEKGRESVIFLGDIFDLWIALPRYETDDHRAFVDWCARQRHRRTVGFMEGNREFFVARRYAHAFAWCTDAEWHRDPRGNVFTHGDRINSRDFRYIRFRRLVKNSALRRLLRVFPFGPSICHGVKAVSRRTNRAIRRTLPEADIDRFFRARCGEGARAVFIGHFHCKSDRFFAQGRSLHLLPDWFGTGEITRFDPAAHQVVFHHWRDIHS